MDETIIPANHDCYLLTHDDGVKKCPIVAWKISGSTAIPITVQSNLDILMPDGRVTGGFKNLDEWSDALRDGWTNQPPRAPAAAAQRVSVNGAALLRSQPRESKAAGLRRRRALRRAVAGT